MSRKMYYTGYRSANTWAELGLIGDSLSFTDDEVVTAVGIGYTKTQVNRRTAMEAALQFTLLNAGQEKMLTRADMLNDHTILAYYIEQGIVHDGWLPEFDEEGVQTGSSRAWVYRADMEPRHINRISSAGQYCMPQVSKTGKYEVKNTDETKTYYCYDDHHYKMYRFVTADDHAYEGTTVMDFMSTRRDLIHNANVKAVLSCISRVLSRLIQGGRIVKEGSGRGRTFRWNNWGWVDGIRQQKTVSNTKARKLGDVVNGWEYVVKDTQEYYGVQIHTYQWLAVNRDNLKFFGVHKNTARSESDQQNDWWYAMRDYDRYKDKFIYAYNYEDIAREVDTFNAYFESLTVEAPPIFGRERKVRLSLNGVHGDNSPVDAGSISLPCAYVQSTRWNFRLPQDAVVEEIASPEEMIQRIATQRTDMVREYMSSVGMTSTDIPSVRVFTEGGERQ